MAGYVPTSTVMHELLDQAPGDSVSLGWVIEQLGERSFGLLMFLLALVALVPGLSGFIGVLLMIPAFQMIMARRVPVLPRFITRRQIPTQRFARLIGRMVPLLRRAERLFKPRWPTPFETLIEPIPFSHVIPSLVIMLVALAYLEEDGVMLCVALAVALASLAITGATVWGTVAGVNFLERL
jgi:hypothetical protein